MTPARPVVDRSFIVQAPTRALWSPCDWLFGWRFWTRAQLGGLNNILMCLPDVSMQDLWPYRPCIRRQMLRGKWTVMTMAVLKHQTNGVTWIER
jgi:hypothetical protein